MAPLRLVPIAFALSLTACGMSRPVMLVDRTFSDLGSAAERLRGDAPAGAAKHDEQVAAEEGSGIDAAKPSEVPAEE